MVQSSSEWTISDSIDSLSRILLPTPAQTAREYIDLLWVSATPYALTAINRATPTCVMAAIAERTPSVHTVVGPFEAPPRALITTSTWWNPSTNAEGSLRS